MCPRHPDTETNLACGKCGILVCPKCMVHTPVGVRCQECAQLKRLPLFEVSHSELFKASLVGLGIGGALGILFGLLSFVILSIPFLPWIALVGIGYAIGEGVSLATNRKRARPLQVIAIASVVVSFIIIAMFTPQLNNDLIGLLSLAASVYVAYTRVR